MIRVEDVTLSPGGNEVLSGATFHLRPGDHAGLVGRNGAGKTTILRAIVGELSPDSGRVVVRSGIRVGWLPQQAVSGSSASVWDEARTGMTRLNALRDEVAAAERAVAADPSQAERLARATEAFRIAGGYAADEKIGEVLHGLGFGPAEWARGCETFSGGWQMRIALARLLLSDPDVALLDEPTNHLDIEARSWLAGFLARAPWAFLVVSHDRWLLDRCVNRIVEVRGGRLQVFAGNFGAYLKERELRQQQLETAHTRQQGEIAKLERFVERFGAKATKAAQAQSRQKTLDKIERIELPDHDRAIPRIRLPEAPPGAHEAIGLVGATLGWSPEAPVLAGVELQLERGMRVALLGPNGAGKSTVLHALAGRLPPLAGRRRVGDRVRIGVFAQDLAQALPGDATALEHLAVEAPAVPPERIRTVLGALGLPGELALRPIAKLSGGEKARVALAGLVVRPCNVLLLDEPTNHLDAETVDVLADAISGWEGALLLVTHDRYLVEQVATHVARIRDGRLELHEGVRPEDFEREALRRDGPAAPTEAALSHADRKKRQRELDRSRKRLGEVQDEIPKAEAQIAKIDDALIAAATDHLKVARLAKDREAAEARVEALYAEWEALEEALA